MEQTWTAVVDALNVMFTIIGRPVQMKRTLDIQTAGSLAVVGTFAVSEWAAWLLDARPGSSLAWHLNAGLFRDFENARLDILPSRFLFGPASLPVAILLIALIVGARVTRSRFAVAAFANFSFVGAVMLAYEALHGPTTDRAASLAAVSLDARSDVVLAGTLLAASFVAFAASHWSFARAIRDGVSADRR